MGYQIEKDNVYQVGTRIFAYEAPEQPLVITKYYQRIYYCTIPGENSSRTLAYFEAELIPPVPAP
ncbi:MAG: hypothetical protein K1X47_10145 [Cyclobacteriaceae bacterium]|nr:hypothetical protein [Cyclobacteriaceae bacterium]